MASQVSKYASMLSEHHGVWWKRKLDKVECEVMQGHKRQVKSLAVGWIQAKKWSLLKLAALILFFFFPI